MSETPAPYLVGPAPVPLIQCPLAGFQHYGGERSWDRLRLHERLVLTREPKNPHDAKAVRVEWRDVVLGYVPRESNHTVAQIMDRGERVEARIVRLFPSRDPWRRVTMEIVWFPDTGAEVEVQRPPPKPPALQAAALLVRSLANRVFGSPPPPHAVEWVKERTDAIALVGVEHPAMLPFLRLVEAGETRAEAKDPLAALCQVLVRAGIERNAWTRLQRWGFGTFEELGPAQLKPLAFARFANLLLRLDVQGPPPSDFARYALEAVACESTTTDPCPDFERHPPWFMRALLKAVGRATTSGPRSPLQDDVPCAVEWLLQARPSPDTNQQHAGWDWIVAQARAHRKARELAASKPWPVPVRAMTFGPWWIVPLRSAVELADEAAEMKNCLEDYEEQCRAGDTLVFSIRDALTSERVACFSLFREGPREAWEIEGVAGKMNEEVDQELWDVARVVAVVLRRRRISASSSACSRARP